MFVCSCRAVTDHAVLESIESGASTVEEIVVSCSAGGRCGGCRPELERLLAQQRERRGQLVTVG